MKHQVIDARSLELHRRIAAKIRRNPALLAIPKNNIKRWLSQGHGDTNSALYEWQKILRKPLDKILAILTTDDEEGCRLRQSSPFTGVLTPKERTKIFQKYEKFRGKTTPP